MKHRIAIINLALSFSTVAAGAVPQAIQPPPGSELKLQTQARGEQVYQCTLNAGQYLWQLQAPDAVLFDEQGRRIGRHFGGPAWEYLDGSRITGKMLRKLDGAPQKSIPWLLLEVVKHEGGGMFAEVRYINRVNTQGGLQPETQCDGNHIGHEKRVPYRASYYFYTAPAR